MAATKVEGGRPLLSLTDHYTAEIMNSVLVPEILDLDCLSRAIEVGCRCFLEPKDRSWLAEVFTLIANGTSYRFSPGIGRHVRIHPHFLYHHQGQPAATGGLCEYEGETDVAYLGWFGVVPEKRRQRIGASVIDHLSRLALLYGYRKLGAVTDNDPQNEAISFYFRQGFSRGNSLVFNGSDSVVYLKPLE